MFRSCAEPGFNESTSREVMKRTIGVLAKEVGVNVETIRFYERRGLLNKPVKPTNGPRIYSESDYETLSFIVEVKSLGFTLQEIEMLLKLGSHASQEALLVARDKLKTVRTKIFRLKKIEGKLIHVICNNEQ